MRFGIGQKIFVGFLLATMVVLALTTGVTRWSFERDFLNYVNENEAESLQYYASRLAEAYADEGDWESVGRDRDRWLELMDPPDIAGDDELLQVTPLSRGGTGVPGSLSSLERNWTLPSHDGTARFRS